jgi:hypothetical protein
LRSSMNLEVVMAALGTHDPRWSAGGSTGIGEETETGATSEIVVIRLPPVDS